MNYNKFEGKNKESEKASSCRESNPVLPVSPRKLVVVSSWQPLSLQCSKPTVIPNVGTTYISKHSCEGTKRSLVSFPCGRSLRVSTQ